MLVQYSTFNQSGALSQHKDAKAEGLGQWEVGWLGKNGGWTERKVHGPQSVVRKTAATSY